MPGIKTALPIFLLAISISTANADVDLSQESNNFVDVQIAKEEPDWNTWRTRQNAAIAALEKPLSPPQDYTGNPIDWFMQRWYEENDKQPGTLADDRTFIRRAYLDSIGLLPPEDQLAEYLADKTAGKRANLVDHLLNDKQAYTEHWMTFWNDLLRNDEQTNIDDLRGRITTWLYPSLYENRAYDIMVAQLLNPARDDAKGFLKGINWRGRINASQRPVIQVAQNVGQVFLATTLKCASCHNHFTRQWTLEDTYGLASFFTEEDLDIYRCDKETGEVAHAAFPLMKGETIDTSADLLTKRQSAARMVTAPENERFTKAIVNRLWHKTIGRGLFEPIDDYDAEIAHPELLNWLAYDFMANGYDLKHTLRLIMTSDIYAQATTPLKYRPDTPDYSQPAPRRISAEMLLDGIHTVTGYFPQDRSLYRVGVDYPVVRAWRYRVPTALVTALGRPNREQVVSARDQQPTVLQMLEMVNGEDLAELMKAASNHVVQYSWQLQFNNINGFVRETFTSAYSRQPTEKEIKVAAEILGTTIEGEEGRQKVEDFLWIVFMSPEFQYIN